MNSSSIKKQDTAVFSIHALTTHAMTAGLRVSVASFAVGCMLVAFIAAPALGQSSSALTAVYGRGVHAYFAGNTALAEQQFSEVIQAGSTDPRPYYFRGVLRLNQGRQFEAENDMRIGAAYEARNPGVQHAIGIALQRVQGPGRRTLEQFRRQGRLERVQQGRQRTQQRYEQLDSRAPNVLRQGSQLPLTQPVQPPQLTPALGSGSRPTNTAPALPGAGTNPQPLQPPTTAQPMPAATDSPADEADPFGAPAPVTPDGDLFGSEPQDATPAPTPAPAEVDPFGELPAPATEEADPFGESPAPAPAEEAPMPAPADDDPFGESADTSEPAAPAESDPFGENADEAMPADEPAEAAPADDPFGESSADSAPAESPASSDEADPFGESMAEDEPADDEPATDDPFGESSSDDSAPAEDSAPADDPFGESSDATDEAPAGESDPFGEGMEEDSGSAEGDSAPEEDSSDDSGFDEDDPFGPLGGTAPTPAGSDAFASASLTPTSGGPASVPAGQLFYSLGQWLGSRGNAMSKSAGNASIAQADFELGPTESNAAETASAEMAFEADPFGDSPTPSTKPAAESNDAPPAEDAFEDDPFGDF